MLLKDFQTISILQFKFKTHSMKKYIILLAVSITMISCSDAQTTAKSKNQKEQSTGIVNKVVTKSEFKTLMTNKEALFRNWYTALKNLCLIQNYGNKAIDIILF